MIPGSLKFAQYAFSPNQLKLCGPRDKNQTIFDYLTAKKSDPGLVQCLEEFEAAYPYISFIAQENHLPDPFSREVVKAYWLGNHLLNNVQPGHFFRFLKERFNSYFKPDDLRELKEAIKQGGKPSHSFHVFKVFPKTGGMGKEFRSSLQLLDNCRISWGEIVGQEGERLVINRRPLILDDGQLKIGQRETVKRLYQIRKKSFLDQPKPGSVVSIHWDWVCDQIDKKELNQLSYWTNQALTQIERTKPLIS